MRGGYYSVTEVAALLGVCRSTIQRMCEAGHLRAWRLPGRKSYWRIDPLSPRLVAARGRQATSPVTKGAAQ